MSERSNPYYPAIRKIPLVGRKREKDELIDGLEDALSWQGRVFLLAGEPGVGKTRMSDELAKAGVARGMKVVWGRCWESGGAPPFWPWVQILRSCVGLCDPAKLEAVIGANAPYLAALIPEAFKRATARGLRPALSGKSIVSAMNSGEAEAERFRLFDSITTFLKNLAASAPLLILLDDLHAADQESVLLLRFLVHEMRQTPIMVIGTYREAEIQLTPRLAILLGELSREGQTIVLHGLSKADVREFVELGTGVVPEEPTVDALHHATDGNPFFLTEIVHLLIEEGRLEKARMAPLGTFRIPEGVRAAVRRRLDLVPQGVRDALRVASVIGREFDLALMQPTCRMDSEQLLTALEQALVLGLVSETPGAIGRFRFSHALVTETLYNDLSGPGRRQFHLQIAEILEQLKSNDSEARLGEIAHHYFRALPAAKAEKAVLYARQAAGGAMRSFAYEEATRLYQLALSAHEFRQHADQTERCELLIGLGEAECRARDYSTFKDTFKKAAELARIIGKPEYLAHAALGYGMLGSDPGVTDPTATALLEEGLAAIGEDASALRATLLARLAEEIRWSASPEQTAAVISQAVDIARRVDDPATLIEALYIKYHSMRGPDATEERLALSTEIVRMTEKYALEDWSLRVRYHRGALLLELAEIAEVDREIDAIHRIPEALRLQHLGFTELIDAMRALIEGRIDDGERLAIQALNVGSHRPNSTAESIFIAQIALVRREQGRLADIVSIVENFIAKPHQWPLWRCLLALCYCHARLIPKAREEFERFAANDFAEFPRDFTWFGSMAYMAETCNFLKDSARAAVLHRLLNPYSSRSASIGFFAYLGSISYYLGILADVMSRFDEARKHFEAAIQFEHKMGARSWLARAQHRYAEMLLSRGGREDLGRARELLAGSRSTGEALGLNDLVDEPSELESTVGPEAVWAMRESESPEIASLIPSRPAAEKGTTGGNLFRREGDFWTIIYGGRVSRLRDVRGLLYIAQLLRYPHKEIRALDLVAGGAPGNAQGLGSAGIDESGEKTNRLNITQTAPEGLHAGGLSDAGEILDAQAKAAYKSRIAELQAEREEASEFGNLGRVAQVEDEIDALTHELASAVGLHGRDRRAASASERARLNVTRAIKTALERIYESDTALGRLLSATIKTGTFCSYAPDPSAPILWEL